MRQSGGFMIFILYFPFLPLSLLVSYVFISSFFVYFSFCFNFLFTPLFPLFSFLYDFPPSSFCFFYDSLHFPCAFLITQFPPVFFIFYLPPTILLSLSLFCGVCQYCYIKPFARRLWRLFFLTLLPFFLVVFSPSNADRDVVGLPQQLQRRPHHRPPRPLLVPWATYRAFRPETPFSEPRWGGGSPDSFGTSNCGVHSPLGY